MYILLQKELINFNKVYKVSRDFGKKVLTFSVISAQYDHIEFELENTRDIAFFAILGAIEEKIEFLDLDDFIKKTREKYQC
ncbi:MAG: hypothetical protein C5B43_03085 [Verrucomicrobia bacterium]|nr:MAG: hypothetical protein C5B43_03085 [Verrucomicrobiota bacterium]